MLGMQDTEVVNGPSFASSASFAYKIDRTSQVLGIRERSASECLPMPCVFHKGHIATFYDALKALVERMRTRVLAHESVRSIRARVGQLLSHPRRQSQYIRH